MHFWIDKRSQGCGFNGRHMVPPSLSGYGRNQRILSGGFYPKPMVTPVHRFQSIESVANNGLRYARSPGYHARLPIPPAVHYNGSSSNIRIPQVGRSLELLNSGSHTPTPQIIASPPPTAKLKCGVWIFFAFATFFLAGVKYYFHGINMGVLEALVFCSLLVIVLIIGGIVSLCEAMSYSPTQSREQSAAIQVPEQTDQEDTSNQVPTSAMPPNNAELPPPPYHIAIMLPPQNDTDSIQVIRDSPPPTYEKAVT